MHHSPYPTQPTSRAGPAPAGRHLDRVLPHLRLPADQRPHPGPLRTPGRPPAVPGLPPGRPLTTDPAAARRHRPRAAAAHPRSRSMLRTPPHPGDQADRTERLLAAVRVALVAALTALVLAIAALAYVVSFEAISAFAVETAALPRRAGLVGAAAGRQLHHRRHPSSSCGGICAARAGASPGMPGPWSAAPPASRSPSTSPTPPSGWPPSCSPPSPRSRCWGRWSC